MNTYEETVVVWGVAQKITVHQKSPSVWIAHGDYMGESIEVKRPTRGAACKGWADAARYRGN